MKKLCILFATCASFLWPAACSPVELLNATIPSDGYRVVHDVRYAGHDRGSLDIYLPDNPAPGHPVVLFYYGGSWKSGDKDDYLFAGQAFASQGIVAVIPDYRLYPQIHFPDFMYDVAEAFVWTHRHIADYGGNPGNLFAAGHSAGAYNAVMMSVNRVYIAAAGGSTRWVRGAIGLAGPYDFLPIQDPDLIDLFGGARRPETQPISFVGRDCPPMLLLAGDKDDEVDPGNTARMRDALQARRDSIETITYPGLDHVGIVLSLADGFRDWAPVLQDIVAFVRAHSSKDE